MGSVLTAAALGVPEVFNADIALNAQIVDAKDDFSVPEVEEKEKPTPDKIAENKAKWGYEA